MRAGQSAPEDRMQTRSTAILAVFSAGVLFGTAQAHAEEQERAAAFRSVIEQADAAAERLAAFRPLVDDSVFEISSAVEGFDFDGDELARFVAEDVRYEPYDGVLRGAQATLSARAGNAIDQSLLLISLLEMAGYDAQLLRAGGGNGELARLLTDAAMRPRQAAPAIADARRLEAALAQALGSRAEDVPVSEISRSLAFADPASLDESVAEAAGRLGALVSEEGDEIPAGDYHWVRYRLGAGMAWTEAHPALAGASPDALEPDEVLTGSASDDMLHFVEIALEAEILENGRLRREPLMTPWRQPVATLFDRPISVGLFGEIDADSETQAGTLFMPSLNDETPPGAQAVTLRGAVLDSGIMDLDSHGMAGVFSTLGDTMQDAGDLVGGRDEDQPSRALTGIVLEVRWVRPSGETREEERWLIDRLANRHAEDEDPRLDLDLTLRSLAHRMNFRRDFIVSAGGGHEAHRLAAALEAEATHLRYGAHLLRAADPDTGALRVREVQPLMATHLPFLLNLQSLIDQEIGSLPEHHVYRDGPLVMSLHRSREADSQEGFAYIDILINPWTGVVSNDGALRRWPEGALARGMLDTQIEVDSGSGDPGSDYFGALARSGGLVIARNAADVSGLPQDARLAAEADLAQGFLLALPSVQHSDASPLWWRVREDGGEVLGRNALGGQTLSDYVTLVGVAWSAYSFGNDVGSCAAGYDWDGSLRTGLGCCLAYAVLYNAGSVAVGYGSGKAMRAAGASAAGSVDDIAHLGALDLITALSVEVGLQTSSVAGGALAPDLTRAGVCGPPGR